MQRLIDACLAGNTGRVTALLDHAVDPRSVACRADERGFTALHVAAMTGAANCTKKVSTFNSADNGCIFCCFVLSIEARVHDDIERDDVPTPSRCFNTGYCTIQCVLNGACSGHFHTYAQVPTQLIAERTHYYNSCLQVIFVRRSIVPCASEAVVVYTSPASVCGHNDVLRDRVLLCPRVFNVETVKTSVSMPRLRGRSAFSPSSPIV